MYVSLFAFLILVVRTAAQLGLDCRRFPLAMRAAEPVQSMGATSLELTPSSLPSKTMNSRQGILRKQARKSRRLNAVSFEPLEDRRLLTEWFAAVNGLSTNSGSISSPWDLQTALMKTAVIQPGDTLYLRGGDYVHPDRSPDSIGYSFYLNGTAGSPVTVRPYQSERATIDGGLVTAGVTASEYVTFRDLEFIVSENLTQPRISAMSGSVNPTDLNRPWGGVNIYRGHAIQLINNVIHANMQGVWFSQGLSGDSMLYGNLIYDNGYTAPDRNHGHGVYAQNDPVSTKIFRDNMMFGAYAYNFHAYGSGGALIDRMIYERNIHWGGFGDDKVLLGGKNPNSNNDFSVRDNVNYDADLQLGYLGYGGTGLVATGNTIWDAQFEDLVAVGFTNPTIQNNFEWGESEPAPRNGAAIPTQAKVVLNPNAYDSNRANLAILNYPNLASAQVTVGSFLQTGDTFALLRPDDFYGTPEFVGVYAGGGTISVPISGKFTAYVMMRTPASGAPTLSTITNKTINEDASTGAIAFTVGDVDTPLANLILTATSSNAGLVPNANLVFGGSGASRTITVTPTANATGVSTITVTVSDGVLATQRQFNVTVQAVNDAPTISNVSNRSAQVGAPFSDVVFTVGDLESSAGSLIVTVQSSNTALAPLSGLILSGSGASRTLKITPAAGVIGNSTITLTVRDPSNATASDTFTLTVTTDTTAPTATADSATTTLRKPSQINVLANDVDPFGELDPSTVVITSSTSYGTVTVDDATGLVTFRPQTSQAVVDQFRYRVRDVNGNLSNEAVVNITVLAGAFGQIPRWTQNMYLDILERAPVTAELDYWTNVISAGSSRETIAYAILSSREERAYYIGNCYQEYLGRGVDQSGEEFWLGVWERTGGPEWIRAGLIGSGEYFQANGGTAAGAVGALYEDLLNRTAVTPEVNYWVNVLQQTPLANVAMGFLTSDEYRLGQINVFYQYYLHRNAEGGGAQFWLQKMKQGLSQERLQAILIASDEYFSYS